MMPAQWYRRPWVLRDTRVPNIVLPERIFPPYEPSQPWWREVRGITLEVKLIRLLAVSAIVLAMLAFLLRRH
jgi:hypothetical protein